MRCRLRGIGDRMATTQLAALRRTVRALKRGGRLTDEHAALLAIAEGMAAAIDAGDAETNTAALWKEYRAAVVVLVEVGADDTDSTAEAVIELLRPALGDAAEP